MLTKRNCKVLNKCDIIHRHLLNTSGLSELKVLMWQCGCACMCACVHAQSCPTLCNPIDCSPPGSSVHGTFQARILNRVAVSFFRGSSWPRNWTSVSCVSCIDRCVLYQLSHQGSPHMPVEQTFKNFTYIREVPSCLCGCEVRQEPQLRWCCSGRRSWTRLGFLRNIGLRWGENKKTLSQKVGPCERRWSSAVS